MPQSNRKKTVLRVLGGLLALGVWYLLGYYYFPRPGIALWLLDFFVLAVAFGAAAMIVSQFVLPVETWGDRNMAFARMLDYMQGSHGPILFVKDGKKIAREGEENKRGPGVILVDSASAVALQTNVAYTRSAGPGVVFTQPGEFIADTLDLRVQTRTNANVKAVTRDGIDVTANVTVRFMLRRGHRSPGQWETDAGPPYYFEEHPAFLAVFGTAVSERYDVPWTDLPPLVAADVWRELLLTRTLNDLFPEEPIQPMPLDALQQELTRRLQPPADQLPGSGEREFQLLHDRGIHVLGVSIGDVRFPKDFYNRRRVRWQTETLQRAKDVRLEAEVDDLYQEGYRDAWLQLRNILTRDLRHKMNAHVPLTVREVARILLDATLEIISQPRIASLARREHETILRMHDWLDNLDETGAQLLIAHHDDAADAE